MKYAGGGDLYKKLRVTPGRRFVAYIANEAAINAQKADSQRMLLVLFPSVQIQ